MVHFKMRDIPKKWYNNNLISAEWLQRHMFPQTLPAGRLSAREAGRISSEIVSRYKNIMKGLSGFGDHRELIEVSFELRTELPGDYCPVCRPPVDQEITSPLVKPTRLVNRVMYVFPKKGGDMKRLSNLEFLAVAEEGEEPDLSIHCSGVSKGKVTSFTVGDTSYDLYLALHGKSANTLDIFLKSTRMAHKMLIYKSSGRFAIERYIESCSHQQNLYTTGS